MSEIVVETPICDICGAEVRDGSLFCYNCGGSVGIGTADSKEATADSLTKLAFEKSDAKASETGSNVIRPGAANGSIAKRRDRNATTRTRVFNRQQIEIVWEPRSGVSVSFIVGSVVVFFLAIILFLTAYFVR